MPRYIILFSLTTLTFLIVSATPPFGGTTNAPPISGSETHMHHLWRNTVASATQTWKTSLNHSSQSDPAVITVTAAPRSGPISAVYRATLSAEQSPACIPGLEEMCQVAADSFAKVGEVRYDFNDTRRNIRGRSKQVMIACRCLSADCELAILVRPVDIFTRSPNGDLAFSGKRTCLYESVNGKLSDCHSEVLRVSYHTRDASQDDLSPDGFDYSVNNEHHGDFWNAKGRRGTRVECLDTDISKIPTVNLSNVKPGDVRFNKHHVSPRQASCRGHGNMQFYRSADAEDGESCFRIYSRTVSAAAHAASQQDCYAVGKTVGTYLQPATVTLVSNTELALSCSATVLGIIFLASLYLKEMKRENSTYKSLAWAVLFQCLSYALEALPLHTALGSEISARDWRSLFAFVDATLGSNTEGSTGVLVITTVLGEVQHNATRVQTVAILTAVFDFIALSLIFLTIVRIHAAVTSKRIA